MHMFSPGGKPTRGTGEGQKQKNVKYTIHQNLLARGCDSSHAGVDGSATAMAAGTVLLGRRGGIRAPGSNPSCGGRLDSCCITPLAGTASCIRDVAGDCRLRAPAARTPLRA